MIAMSRRLGCNCSNCAYFRVVRTVGHCTYNGEDCVSIPVPPEAGCQNCAHEYKAKSLEEREHEIIIRLSKECYSDLDSRGAALMGLSYALKDPEFIQLAVQIAKSNER